MPQQRRADRAARARARACPASGSTSASPRPAPSRMSRMPTRCCSPCRRRTCAPPRPRSAPHIKAGTPVIACAKGIERGTHRFMTEIIGETIPAAVPAILSGPSFATDVARGLPTAVTLACADEAIAARACARARLADVPALSLNRRARRRDRRRGEERARDRGRHRAGPQARRERDRRAGDARLCGTCALRPRARRAHRNAHRPLGPRRPDPHLLVAAVAQLLARHRARRRPRSAEASSPKARSRRARWSSLRTRRTSRCRSRPRSRP